MVLLLAPETQSVLVVDRLTWKIKTEFIALHFLEYLDSAEGPFEREISRPAIYPQCHSLLSSILDGKI